MFPKRIDPRRHQAGRIGSGLVFAAFAVIALFFLLTEHRAHLFGALPFVLLLACPLLHMLHGHGGHSHPADGPRAERQPPATAEPDTPAPNSGASHHHH